MRRTLHMVLSVMPLVSILSARQDMPAPVPIIPTPSLAVVKSSGFALTSRTRILLGSSSSREQFAARQINEALSRWNIPSLSIVPAESYKGEPSNFIFIGDTSSTPGSRFLKSRNGALKPEMTSEGYFLDVDKSGVVIIAASERGKFYGVMSLLQMFQRTKRGVIIPGVTVSDFPLHRMRGISDDISRGQVSTVENFKRIIRFLARYKINTYALYIEDIFAFRNHPLIGKNRGALTAAEVREIDAYAKQFYIEVIPIFQTLGHWENILSMPEYVGYAEYPGGRTLNISDERVYVLLDEMIGEVCQAFSSPYFNIACDETADVGLGATKDRVAKLGLASVLAEHYNKVADIVRKHGKKPMMYGDILLKNPDILQKIPKDIVIVDWNYDPLRQFEGPKVFKNAGFRFVVSPAVRNYAGPFIDTFNSFENIQRFSRAGYDQGAEGVLISSWNDYGGEELRELNYYGYAWGAECAWHPIDSDVEAFNRAFFRDFFAAADSVTLQSVYAILSSPANQYSWHELWRHPMLPFLPPMPQKGHSANIMERLQSIKTTMPLVQTLLGETTARGAHHADQLDILRFVARLNLWFAEKVETQEEVRQLSVQATAAGNRDSLAQEIVMRCRKVVDDLLQVRDEFARLWRRTNKPEGLELLLQRYDRQAAYWLEKIDEVQHGAFWVNPEIESAWICHPSLAPTSKDSGRAQQAYFRKAFRQSGHVSSAKLQLIGDTYAHVWVNGKALGEVFVRRSNSLCAEHARVKVFDIGALLNDSTNVIAVEARNYLAGGIAGFNVYCEVRLADGSTRRIISDTTWKVSSDPEKAWESSGIDDSNWQNAVLKSYPYTVVRPNFATGRNSWIER